MTIYTETNYRKIYEQLNGPIPKDSFGRSYEIHHVDGNHSNNDPANLICVSIQEHYDIHYAQGDWSACLLISNRLQISPEEKSRIASLENQKRVATGTHHFLGHAFAAARNKKLIVEGTHNFLGGEVQHKRIVAGTHNFLKREDGTSLASDKVMQGKHHLLGGEVQRKQLDSGTHPSQQEWKCEICGKVGKHRAVYTRFHGEKCRWADI